MLNLKLVRMLQIKASRINWPKEETTKKKDFCIFLCVKKEILSEKHSVEQCVTLDFNSARIPWIQYFFLFIIFYPTQFRFCWISFATKFRATREMKEKKYQFYLTLTSRSFFNILSTFARIYFNVNCQRIFASFNFDLIFSSLNFIGSVGWRWYTQLVVL